MDEEDDPQFRGPIARWKNKQTGSYKVICGGKAVLPGPWASAIPSWLLILIPSILQMIFVNSQFKNAFLLDLLYICTMSISLIYLLATTITDPGVIPRGKKNELFAPSELGITLVPPDQES